MSTYTDCGEAARRLIDEPALRIATDGPSGVFTDIDVILLAAREASLRGEAYSDDMMKVAQREASQALGYLFRSGHVVRYGPVIIPEIGDLDYVRIETRIVYASSDGPAEIITPNGPFPRMLDRDDPIRRTGRRLGAARNDLMPWADQDIINGAPTNASNVQEREVLRLRAEVAGHQMRLADAHAENRLLRQRLAALHVPV